jgi:uncharacterized protein
MKKTALITGASSGIGNEFACILAHERFDLVLVARSEDKLNKLAQELIANYKVQVRVVAADLSKPEAADNLYNRLIAENIKVDVLVNNAGFGLMGLFSQTDMAVEQNMIDLNITTLTRLTKLLLPAMLERKSGHILNIASTAAFQPGPNMAVYFATKAYVLHFTEALAYEIKDSGVTATALCPGPTQSGFGKVAKAEDSKAFQKDLPTASEVARLGIHAMFKGKTFAIHGWQNRMLVFFSRFVSRNMRTRMAGYMMSR